MEPKKIVKQDNTAANRSSSGIEFSTANINWNNIKEFFSDRQNVMSVMPKFNKVEYPNLKKAVQEYMNSGRLNPKTKYRVFGVPDANHQKLQEQIEKTATFLVMLTDYLKKSKNAGVGNEYRPENLNDKFKPVADFYVDYKNSVPLDRAGSIAYAIYQNDVLGPFLKSPEYIKKANEIKIQYQDDPDVRQAELQKLINTNTKSNSFEYYAALIIAAISAQKKIHTNSVYQDKNPNREKPFEDPLDSDNPEGLRDVQRTKQGDFAGTKYTHFNYNQTDPDSRVDLVREHKRYLISEEQFKSLITKLI